MYYKLAREFRQYALLNRIIFMEFYLGAQTKTAAAKANLDRSYLQASRPLSATHDYWPLRLCRAWFRLESKRPYCVADAFALLRGQLGKHW